MLSCELGDKCGEDEIINMTRAWDKESRSSVDSVAAQCLGGHGFGYRGDSDFSLSRARVMLIISSSSQISRCSRKRGLEKPGLHCTI